MKNLPLKNYLLKLSLIFVCHVGWLLHRHGIRGYEKFTRFLQFLRRLQR